MKEEDMYNYILKAGPMRTVSMKVVDDYNVRCLRCDHIAERHLYGGGCCWSFKQENSEYSYGCRLSMYDIIRQNKNGLEYTFDLLS